MHTVSTAPLCQASPEKGNPQNARTRAHTHTHKGEKEIDLFEGISSCIRVDLMNPKSGGGGRPAGDSGKSCNSSPKATCWWTRRRQHCRWSPQAVCWENFLLLQEGQPFLLVRPSSDWMRPTHIMEDNLLHFSTNLNLHFTQNSLPGTSRVVLDQISWHHGAAKLIHKINHHNHQHTLEIQ